jgi:hypothetical protein
MIEETVSLSETAPAAGLTEHHSDPMMKVYGGEKIAGAF